MITRLTRCKARMVAVAIAVAAIQPISALAQGQAAGPQVPREGGTPLPAAPSALATGQSIVMGGVPSGQATSAVLPLSLGDAIARGLEQNLGVVLGEQAVRSAAGVRWQSLSGVLPTAGLRVSQSRQEINLEEYGFPVAPGAVADPRAVQRRRRCTCRRAPRCSTTRPSRGPRRARRWPARRSIRSGTRATWSRSSRRTSTCRPSPARAGSRRRGRRWRPRRPSTTTPSGRTRPASCPASKSCARRCSCSPSSSG